MAAVKVVLSCELEIFRMKVLKNSCEPLHKR